MIKQGTIILFKKKYFYKFSTKAMRFFMEKYKLDTFEQYHQKLAELQPKKGTQLSFKGFYVLANLVITAIEAASPDITLDFDADEFIDEIREYPETADAILASFLKSQPVQKPAKALGKQQGAEQK